MRRIASLRPGEKHVDVEGVVSAISEEKVVRLRSGREARVVDAVLSDDSGSIRLSLWNDDIDKVSEGARIKIENGYVTMFRGEKKLNVGLYGRLIAASEG